MKKDNKLIVLTAGGTGGHVYPADALANELLNRGLDVMLFTDSRGLNNYKGKLGEIENKAIFSGSVVGKSIMTKIMSLIKVAFGVLQAGYYLIKRRPRCVVGFGGYASFPTAVAAVLLRIPLVIHEQNSVMSRTNRILARFATFVAQSFRHVKNTPMGVKTVLSGMPVRQAITDLYRKKYLEPEGKEKINLIILGGSQGAKVFAEVVPQALKLLDKAMQRRIFVCQQCRKGEEEKVMQQYQEVDIKPVIRSFFENMPELYAKAHLMISRAGASSVYEIAAVGVPSILVPLPTAADNHQYFNAKEFSDVGAAVLIKQGEFTPEKLAEVLRYCFKQPQVLKNMSDCAKKHAIIDAAKRLADAVLKL